METNTAAHMRQDLFGLPFDPLTMTQAMDRCRAAIQGGDYLSVGVVNAAKVMTMRRDVQLREAVTGCDMVLADGQSVVWASRMLRAPLPERVAGIDLFLELLAEAAQKEYRVYFLGARRDVLNRMLEEISRRFPGLQIAGARDGYFRPEEELAVAEEIRRFRSGPAVRRYVLTEEGTLPQPVGQGDRRPRRARRRRLVRRAGRPDQQGAALVAAQGPRMALPRAAGTTQARSQVPEDQLCRSSPWLPARPCAGVRSRTPAPSRY